MALARPSQGFCAAPAHESLKREFANIEARFS
jgi:hypothetical protein